MQEISKFYDLFFDKVWNFCSYKQSYDTKVFDNLLFYNPKILYENK